MAMPPRAKLNLVDCPVNQNPTQKERPRQLLCGVGPNTKNHPCQIKRTLVRPPCPVLPLVRPLVARPLPVRPLVVRPLSVRPSLVRPLQDSPSRTTMRKAVRVGQPRSDHKVGPTQVKLNLRPYHIHLTNKHEGRRNGPRNHPHIVHLSLSLRD